MAVTELRYIGRTARQTTISRIDAVMAKWLADWSITTTTFKISEIPSNTENLQSLQWTRMSSANHILTLGFSNGMNEKIGQYFTKTEWPDGSGLSVRIGDHAIKDLSAAILGVKSEEVIRNPLDDISQVSLNERYGNIIFSISANDLHFYTAIHATLINKISPRKPSTNSLLTKPLPAASDVDIPMQVRIDFGDVPISTMVALKVGNVLVSNVKTDSNFILELAHGNKSLANASLHRNGLYRSINLIDSENTNVK